MYINTMDKESMKESIYQLLNINDKQLDELLDDCYKQLQDDHQVFILDDQYDFFLKYIKEHLTELVDEIMFVHLARRLNRDNDNNGYSFIDVLTKDTSLSSYLKEYGLTFKYDDHIKMYINDQEVSLEGDNEYANGYLKQRFGYLYHDYTFSGYAFGDELVDTDYYEAAKGGPEFFGYLYPYGIDDDAIIDNFYDNSEFYQFEYVIPIKDILFDNYEDLDDQEKSYHIIVKTLQHLYFNKYDPVFNKDNNVVIKMINDQILGDKYLKNKIKI